MELDTFLLTVYCIVDDLYKALVATNPPPQCGRRPEMADSEVLTLILLAQWQHNRSERAFLRYARRHWQSYFPRLLSQSAFNRRSRGLWGVLCHLGPTLAQATARLLGTPAAYEVLDTLPVPLMRRCRGQRRRLFGAEAAIGYGGSDRDWYYGVSLLAVVNPLGQITGFVAGPAATEGRWLAEALLRWRRYPLAPVPQAAELEPILGPSHRGPRLGPTGPIAPRLGVGHPGDLYLGDRGFAGAQWQQHWQQAYGAQVLTPRDLPYSRTPWLAQLRQVVERVFQVLDALFGVKFPRARTHWGLLTRLAAKIAALNIMVHLNYSENRPALAFMSPFD